MSRAVSTRPESAGRLAWCGWTWLMAGLWPAAREGGIDSAGIFGPGAPGFGGLFERLFGRPEAGPARGEDLRVDLVLSLHQVLTGGKQVVSMSRPGSCPDCPPGDAYVIIRTATDPRFVREGANLWHVLHIGVPDAVLGTTATLPALDGQVQIPVPPGTQSRGRGRRELGRRESPPARSGRIQGTRKPSSMGYPRVLAAGNRSPPATDGSASSRL